MVYIIYQVFLLQVYVEDVLCGTIKYDPLKFSYEVTCAGNNGIIGSWVKLVNEKTYLTLCEVRVWGPAEPVVDDDDEDIVGELSGDADDSISVAACSLGEVSLLIQQLLRQQLFDLDLFSFF